MVNDLFQDVQWEFMGSKSYLAVNQLDIDAELLLRRDGRTIQLISRDDGDAASDEEMLPNPGAFLELVYSAPMSEDEAGQEEDDDFQTPEEEMGDLTKRKKKQYDSDIGKRKSRCSFFKNLSLWHD